MNANLKKIWETQKKLLQDNLKEEINFFKKPVSLEVIVNGALLTLDTLSAIYIERLKNETNDENPDINSYIKYSKSANFIIKKTSDNNYNDIIVLINACSTSDPTIDILNSMQSDFNSSVNSINMNDIKELEEDVEFYIFCLYFINYLIFLIIDAIKNYEIPSIRRTKYLQSLIRTQSAYMKKYVAKYQKDVKKLDEMLKSLISLDTLIVAIVGASYYYLTNRKKSQGDSLESINNIISNCNPNIPKPVDVSINTKPLETIDIGDINCDIEDEVESPTLPLINEEVSCEVLEETELEVDPIYAPSLITDAIIKNSTTKSFSITTSIGASVDIKTKIAKLDASIIYSPVEGIVSDIKNNKIYIKNINEYEDNKLDDSVKKLVSNYKLLNDILSFIKTYNVKLVYPIQVYNHGKVKINSFSNIREQHLSIEKQYAKNLKSYNDAVQEISSYENMKPYLEDNKVDEVKNKIDVETQNILGIIKKINDRSANTHYNTITTPSDYELFGYYIILLSQLNTSLSLTEIEKSLNLKLLEYVEKRYIIEKNQESYLKDLINDKIKEIEKGLSLKNYFKEIVDIYNKNKNVNDVKNYLTDLASKNKKLDVTEKEEYVKVVMYLFNFWLSTDNVRKKYNNLKITVDKVLEEESTWVKLFLNDQWKQYDSLNEENVKIQNELSELNVFPGYGIVIENEIRYRLYDLNDNANCDNNTDSITNPDAKDDLYTFKYWVKYMSYITLIGAADLLSWSTGLVLPTGPVKLPVIYVPVIPLKTPYGLVLIGLTICGIYFSPLITYNNMTLSPKSIAAGNLFSFKDEIEALKTEINNIGKTLKNDVIQPILNNLKDELIPITQQIADIKNGIKEHKLNKPTNAVKNHTKFIEWVAKETEFNQKYADLNIKKFKIQFKYKIVSDFQSMGKLNSEFKDASLDKIDDVVNSTNKKLDKLNSLLDKVDTILATLPTSLAPNSINFGATLKNPKLVVEIDAATNENLDTTVLDGLFDKHKKSNEDYMAPNYIGTLNSNLKEHYDTIKSSINKIVTKEPYPTYDRIGLKNLGFLKFGKNFVETGAKSFGIPGQLPLPT